MHQIIECCGSNNNKLPHIGKQKLRHSGGLSKVIHVTALTKFIQNELTGEETQMKKIHLQKGTKNCQGCLYRCDRTYDETELQKLDPIEKQNHK